MAAPLPLRSPAQVAKGVCALRLIANQWGPFSVRNNPPPAAPSCVGPPSALAARSSNAVAHATAGTTGAQAHRALRLSDSAAQRPLLPPQQHPTFFAAFERHQIPARAARAYAWMPREAAKPCSASPSATWSVSGAQGRPSDKQGRPEADCGRLLSLQQQQQSSALRPPSILFGEPLPWSCGGGVRLRGSAAAVPPDKAAALPHRPGAPVQLLTRPASSAASTGPGPGVGDADAGRRAPAQEQDKEGKIVVYRGKWMRLFRILVRCGLAGGRAGGTGGDPCL